MRSFFGAKQAAGRRAIVRQGARLDLAQATVTAGRRPLVQAYESFRLESGEAEALARLAAARNLKRQPCITLLDEGQYSMVQLEAPAVPAEERTEALRWRLKDAVDFPVEAAAVGVLDIPADGVRQPGVLVVAAAASVIGERMALFQKAGLFLDVIDIPELAVRNVATLFEEENRGLACVLLTDGGCLLVISFRGELVLARRIDLTAATLAQADEERRQQLLERLALELQRTLDNFDRQYGYVSISRLMLASEFDGRGVVAALADNLYLPVLVMDLAEVMDFPGVPELKGLERQAQGLLAIGLALRT